MQLNELIKEAMKAGDKQRVSTLRLVLSELNRGSKKEYTNQELYSVVRKMVKNAEQYPTATSVAEIEVLTSLLPAERTDAEILQAIASATSIKEAMLLAPADVDRSRVSALFRSRNV